LDPPIPEKFQEDPETARRGHLTARFGLVGSFFGSVYAAFYLIIGHIWGANIILLCSCCFVATPFVLKRAKKIETTGNFLVAVMACGFCALCGCEGGMRGHAYAWLVTVPLCALLLAGSAAARWWTVIAFVAASVIASVDLCGREMPVFFNPKWGPLVSAAGYLGLILFLYLLGQIFEKSRARAFGKMKEAVQELETSNKSLVQLNVEKNEFLGMAAHDLKNPLGVILGSADLIAMSSGDPETLQMVESISAAATRMRNLITELLDANAIEQGMFASKREVCDAAELVNISVENNYANAARKNITLAIGATPNLLAKADRNATLQILDNLISNAVKYSPPATTVHIHTMPEVNTIVIAVRDEGPGLSHEDQKKLFGKYTRLTARPTGGESSTGLGLSIVKKLAETMSGSVHCHSTLGNGATFSLRLPVWPKEEGFNPSVVPADPGAKCIPFPIGEKRSACN
jgi:signal transduction histidine kinase